MSSTLHQGDPGPGQIPAGERRRPKRHPPAIPPFSPQDVTARAREHLTELQSAQRTHAKDVEVTGIPGARRAGRRLRREWIRVLVALERLRRAAQSPRHVLGRRLMWWRLVVKPQRLWDPRLLAAVVAIGLLIASQLGLTVPGVVWIVYGAVVGVSAAGSLTFLWDDFVRCPFQAWRVRRRIRKFPACILPSTPGSKEAWLVPSEDPLGWEIIPRDDLYYEVLPGILRRHHRDVQIVVGEPGSGKTTALIGLAGLLAKIGMVPVLVPLRGQTADHVVDAAAETFKRQVDTLVRSGADSDALWRWLYRRKRVAVLTDDIDQIGPDGERGFVLRRTLARLATEDLPIVVTARPAGIPAGVAASSVDLGELDEESVVSYVRRAALTDPGADPELQLSDRELTHWVREGRLAEAPFYLELLASLCAGRGCPELPAASVLQSERKEQGRFRRKPGGNWEWNPLWVRFRLLECYYDGIVGGTVRRWLGIERYERRHSLRELEAAALGMLRVTGHEADRQARTAKVNGAALSSQLQKRKLQDFLDEDDRAVGESERQKVSQHEVVDTGERLRIVDRDEAGELQFRHRIMQAYLAGRRLADTGSDSRRWQGFLRTRLNELLNANHPEKLTAHMAITFAALRAHDQGRPRTTAETGNDRASVRAAKYTAKVLDCLLDEPARRLGSQDASRDGQPRQAATVATSVAGAVSANLLRPDAARTKDGKRHRARGAMLDPTDPRACNGKQDRTDPDDLLLRLTTAANIAQAIGCGVPKADIATLVGNASGATRWTKLGAIESIAALEGPDESWDRIWEFARDHDYRVRRAAAEEIQRNANAAYAALAGEADNLIMRAAARSALGLPLVAPERPSPVPAATQRKRPESESNIEDWTSDDAQSLKALGWVLPAVVSGLREEPSTAPVDHSPSASEAQNGGVSRDDGTSDEGSGQVQRARQALEWLVALAVKGGHHDLEASLAQGFKGDAMRHAQDPDGKVSGPGWVASNRRLVADVCLGHAEFWYARMLLHQALALYAIAGASPSEAFEAFAQLLHGRRERHEFVRRAGKLARCAVERKLVGSELWTGLIWNDEGDVVSRRATALDDATAILVADITLLLNLNELSGEDRQAKFGYMQELPYCLKDSSNRREILGAGCAPQCGWGFCPYKQPPPDEPNAHRGVSRAFCRQQQQIAARHFRRPKWHRKIGRRPLEDFWWEMERRART